MSAVTYLKRYDDQLPKPAVGFSFGTFKYHTAAIDENNLSYEDRTTYGIGVTSKWYMKEISPPCVTLDELMWQFYDLKLYNTPSNHEIRAYEGLVCLLIYCQDNLDNILKHSKLVDTNDARCDPPGSFMNSPNVYCIRIPDWSRKLPIQLRLYLLSALFMATYPGQINYAASNCSELFRFVKRNLLTKKSPYYKEVEAYLDFTGSHIYGLLKTVNEEVTFESLIDKTSRKSKTGTRTNLNSKLVRNRLIRDSAIDSIISKYVSQKMIKDIERYLYSYDKVNLKVIKSLCRDTYQPIVRDSQLEGPQEVVGNNSSAFLYVVLDKSNIFYEKLNVSYDNVALLFPTDGEKYSWIIPASDRDNLLPQSETCREYLARGFSLYTLDFLDYKIISSDATLRRSLPPKRDYSVLNKDDFLLGIKPVGYPTFSAASKKFTEHCQNLLNTINALENYYGLEKQTVGYIVKGLNILYLDIATFWRQTSIGMSVYTYLIRFLSEIDLSTNTLEPTVPDKFANDLDELFSTEIGTAKQSQSIWRNLSAYIPHLIAYLPQLVDGLDYFGNTPGSSDPSVQAKDPFSMGLSSIVAISEELRFLKACHTVVYKQYQKWDTRGLLSFEEFLNISVLEGSGNKNYKDCTEYTFRRDRIINTITGKFKYPNTTVVQRFYRLNQEISKIGCVDLDRILNLEGELSE